jgi:hypothetical protein
MVIIALHVRDMYVITDTSGVAGTPERKEKRPSGNQQTRGRWQFSTFDQLCPPGRRVVVVVCTRPPRRRLGLQRNTRVRLLYLPIGVVFVVPLAQLAVAVIL